MDSTSTSLDPVQYNQKKRVLIVDNDDKVQHLFQRIFQNMGFETSTTWSGYEALGLIESGPVMCLGG